MIIKKIISTLIFVLAMTTGNAHAGLIGLWEFNDNKDAMGNFGDLQQRGTNISNGSLNLRNTTWASAVNYTGPLITEKTLVSWVSLDNLSVRNGSVLTIDTLNRDVFDGIVWAERRTNQWMAGSNNFSRTQDINNSTPTVVNQEHMVAISYRLLGTSGVQISLYIDGILQGSYSQGGIASFGINNTEILFGARHTIGGRAIGPNISGSISEARIYDVALSGSEIAALRVGGASAQPASAPTTIVLFSMALLSFFRLRSKI
ncbi:LamG-like jellyroll fold domain-containing protein [Glaciecola petra]|uniref:LamG-like jellyroll fold domain-containing protein n=1 Tax=Glaciecola petra TaxID=3075602 RepID=A0ABU2ZUJ5_9ALTE|nr:LamG-like jellyroll fold domain-containing protein [Aestuariibacter sp. P117]MDT0596260.1 LamG-like jellyroll fold domain-containing protein [Aestuariibacter sp. P117]